MRSIRTRRRLVHFETYGEGRVPIVLVHGNFASSRWWRALGRHLPKSFVAHAPNLPGFAGSPLDARRVTIASLAEDVAEFADAIAVEHFHLVGHSLGTAVALELAHRLPDRVVSLALIAPVPARGLSVLLDAHRTMRMFDPRRPFAGSTLQLMHAIAQWFGAHRNALEKTLVKMAPSLDDHPELPALVDDAAAMTPRAIVEMFEALVRFDPSSCIDRVRSPTLVIAGEADPLIPIDHARELAERLPCAKLEGYRGISHGVPLEAPEAVARSLARFVRFGRRWLAARSWFCSATRPS